MFGFSFGELVVLVIVAIVVIGPKDMPKVLRKLGQLAGKLRRMASDLRAQSGIDDVLRTEGLTEDLNEIRKLARGELDTVARAIGPGATVTSAAARPARSYEDDKPNAVDRDREHPKDGPDTANAMPDTAFVYAEGFPRSKWADDPVWKHGEAAAPGAPGSAPTGSAAGASTTAASATVIGVPAPPSAGPDPS